MAIDDWTAFSFSVGGKAGLVSYTPYNYTLVYTLKMLHGTYKYKMT